MQRDLGWRIGEGIGIVSLIYSAMVSRTEWNTFWLWLFMLGAGVVSLAVALGWPAGARGPLHRSVWVGSAVAVILFAGARLSFIYANLTGALPLAAGLLAVAAAFASVFAMGNGRRRRWKEKKEKEAAEVAAST